MTVAEYLCRWISEDELHVRTSTHQARTLVVTRHLIPGFSGIELEDLTAAQCQAYADDKLRGGRADGCGGLSVVSVQKHISILRQALGDAVRLGLLPSNPAQYVRLPRQKEAPERMVFLTAEQARDLIAAFDGSWLRLPVILALYYGLRRSEVLGLQWSAIDFAANTLTVQHTVVHTMTVIAEDAVKSASSRRTFELLPEVRGELLALCPSSARGYVFRRADGSPCRPDCLTRSFTRILERAGLPPMRFHDLRHSTASILFDRGWSLQDVKEWLGHSDIETTSNIYLHYSRGRKVLLARSLEGMLL